MHTDARRGPTEVIRSSLAVFLLGLVAGCENDQPLAVGQESAQVETSESSSGAMLAASRIQRARFPAFFVNIVDEIVDESGIPVVPGVTDPATPFKRQHNSSSTFPLNKSPECVSPFRVV